MRFIGDMIVFSLTVAMLSAFTTSTNASEIRLTSANGDSWHSSIGVDDSNNVHVVWQDTRDGNDEVYYAKLSSSGSTLISDTRLTSDGAVSEWPIVGLDGDGNVHVIWRDSRDGDEEIYYTKLDNSGAVLVDDTRLTNGSNNSWGLDLAVTQSGQVTVVWVDYRDGHAEIYYAELDNNGSKIVSDTRLTTFDCEKRWPFIVTDNSDNAHIIWYDTRSGNPDLFYKQLNSSGETLVDETRLTSSGAASGAPIARVDPSNYVHVIWADTRDTAEKLFYTKLDNVGNTLVADKAVVESPSSHGGTAGGYNSYMDGYDLYVTWVDGRDGNDEVYYTKLNNNGSALTADIRLTYNVSSSWWPRISVDGSHAFHIVWDDDRDGNRELYYINNDIITDVEEYNDSFLPSTISLSQNYPNPFNPTTEIEFELTRRSNVRVIVYNLLGQEVSRLVDQELSAGNHRVTWDGCTRSGMRASAGVYFYRLEAEGFNETKKMLLLK